MNLIRRNLSGFCIIDIEGRLDTTNYNQFENKINEIIEEGEINIVLDCKGLNYISSSGLRVLLIAQKKLMSLNGKLHLCCMQATIKEIFDISGFSSIFKIFASEEDAVNG